MRLGTVFLSLTGLLLLSGVVSAANVYLNLGLINGNQPYEIESIAVIEKLPSADQESSYLLTDREQMARFNQNVLGYVAMPGIAACQKKSQLNTDSLLKKKFLERKQFDQTVFDSSAFKRVIGQNALTRTRANAESVTIFLRVRINSCTSNEQVVGYVAQDVLIPRDVYAKKTVQFGSSGNLKSEFIDAQTADKPFYGFFSLAQVPLQFGASRLERQAAIQSDPKHPNPRQTSNYVGWAYAYAEPPRLIAKATPVIHDYFKVNLATKAAFSDIFGNGRETSPYLFTQLGDQLIPSPIPADAFYAIRNPKPVVYATDPKLAALWDGTKRERSDAAPSDYVANGDYQISVGAQAYGASKTFEDVADGYVRLVNYPAKAGQYLVKNGDILYFGDFKYSVSILGGKVQVKIIDVLGANAQPFSVEFSNQLRVQDQKILDQNGFTNPAFIQFGQIYPENTYQFTKSDLLTPKSGKIDLKVPSTADLNRDPALRATSLKKYPGLLTVTRPEKISDATDARSLKVDEAILTLRQTFFIQRPDEPYKLETPQEEKDRLAREAEEKAKKEKKQAENKQKLEEARKNPRAAQCPVEINAYREDNYLRISFKIDRGVTGYTLKFYDAANPNHPLAATTYTKVQASATQQFKKTPTRDGTYFFEVDTEGSYKCMISDHVVFKRSVVPSAPPGGQPGDDKKPPGTAGPSLSQCIGVKFTDPKVYQCLVSRVNPSVKTKYFVRTYEYAGACMQASKCPDNRKTTEKTHVCASGENCCASSASSSRVLNYGDLIAPGDAAWNNCRQFGIHKVSQNECEQQDRGEFCKWTQTQDPTLVPAVPDKCVINNYLKSYLEVTATDEGLISYQQQTQIVSQFTSYCQSRSATNCEKDYAAYHPENPLNGKLNRQLALYKQCTLIPGAPAYVEEAKGTCNYYRIVNC